MAKTIDEIKTDVVGRATIELENAGYSLSQNDKSLLGYYFDDAVVAICKWRKIKKDNDEFLLGTYNGNINKFIVRKFQERGIEGQASSNVGGDVKAYKYTPEQELLIYITQRV